MKTDIIFVRYFSAALFLLFDAATAHAIPITDLYNTGVDNNGNALGDLVADPHYSITSPTRYTATTVAEDGYPISTRGPWISNTSTSRWIGPDTNNATAAPNLNMGYITTFTLAANADLSTVQITGLGAADDRLDDVLLNGNSLGRLFAGFRNLTPFSITSGFVSGVNTLEFIVHNSRAGGPTGLRIQDITGSYQLAASVPEPGLPLLITGGLLLMGLTRWRTQTLLRKPTCRPAGSRDA